MNMIFPPLFILFSRSPGEEEWASMLLADGNLAARNLLKFFKSRDMNNIPFVAIILALIGCKTGTQ